MRILFFPKISPSRGKTSYLQNDVISLWNFPNLQFPQAPSYFNRASFLIQCIKSSKNPTSLSNLLMVVANLKDFTPFLIFQNHESSKSSCHDPLSRYGSCIFLPKKKKKSSSFQNPSMWSVLSFHKRILSILNSKEKSQWCEKSQRLSITSTLNLKNSNSDSMHMSCISYKSIFKNLKNQSQCPCICHAS